MGFLLACAVTARAEVPPAAPYPLPRVDDEAPASARADATRAAPALAVATPAAVVTLPPEVVHGGGVTFGEDGFTLQVSSKESGRMPGGFADPTRYLQALPGVANDSDFDGLLYVQGGDGGQNRILLDRVSVSDAYHFGGVVSVLNTDVIERVELMPGGYTAEYGDALSGVLQVRRRVGNPVATRGTASINLLSANGTAEGPIGNDGRGSWLVAARRSYVDQVLKGRAEGPTALPAYWDVDARLYRRGDAGDFRLGLLRSGDRLSARLSDTFTFAPAESSGLVWDRAMTLATLNWERPAGSWALSQAVAYGWRDQSIVLAGGLPQHASADTRSFDWRLDAKQAPRRGLGFASGVQLTHTHTQYDLDINRLSILEPDRRSNPRSPLDTARVLAGYEGRNAYLAGYAQTDARLADSTLDVTAGVRVEHGTRSRETAATPRLRVRWRTPWDGVSVHAAAGSYRQFPADRLEADPTIGNPDLAAERADHYVLGVARAFARGGRVSVEGYWKNLSDLIVYDAGAPAGAPPFVNTGTGQARGVEFLLHLPRVRWDAWLAYSLGRVTYRDFPGAAEYAPAQDIRHTVSFVGRYRPSESWTLGVRFRAQSGRPYTAVVGREDVSEFVDGVDWVPVLGQYNGSRFPGYGRLDVRAERAFRIGNTRLNVAAEVINVLNRRNLYDYRYVDGYGRAEPVEMLPILPTLGVAVAF
jgi:hypothetical protein